MRRSFVSSVRVAVPALVAFLIAAPAMAGYRFASIFGGTSDRDDWKGHPALAVNTASLCAHAGQVDDLQALHETFGPRGQRVPAVPPDDFRQKPGTDAGEKEFCATTLDLTLPLAGITHVRGAQAHPFHARMLVSHGFEPGGNFNKVLAVPDGQPLVPWGRGPRPAGGAVRGAIAALPR